MALAVVATLAVPMGLGTATLLALELAVLRPLPFPGAARLVSITTSDPSLPQLPQRVSGPELLAWVRGSTTLQSVAGAELPHRRAAIAGEPSGAMLRITPVSSSYFDTLKVTPAIGRTFHADPKIAAWELVLSDATWRRFFGGDAAVLGRLIQFPTLAGSWQIVGVMPPGFTYPGATEIWQASRALNFFAEPASERTLDVIARLRDEKTIDDAATELRLLSSRLGDAYSPGQHGWRPTVERLDAVSARNYETTLSAIALAAVLVLLIAGVNVTNLVRASIDARRAELAVRLVLGANRWRIWRLCLTELAACFVAGWAAAWLLAWWLLAVGAAILPADMPRVGELGQLGWKIGASAAGVAAIMLIVVAAALLKGATLNSLTAVAYLRTGHYRTAVRPFRLLVGQVAPALALTVAAVLVGKTLWLLQQRDLGFEPRGLVVAHVTATPDLALWIQDGTAERRQERLLAGMHALLGHLRSRPGVAGAELIDNRPFDENVLDYAFDGNNQPARSRRDAVWYAPETVVTPGYFSLMETDLLAGRLFSDAERLDAVSTWARPASRTLIVNRMLARKLWGSPDAAINQRLGPDTVIGVVEDVGFGGFGQPSQPRIYYSFVQRPQTSVSVLVRSHTSRDLREEIATAARSAIGPTVKVFGYSTGEAIVAGWLRPQRLTGWLVTLFASVAMGVALIGVFAVVTAQVQQRRREFGIRLALGAAPATLVRNAAADVGGSIATGVVVGSLIASALSRMLAGSFYGAAELDAWTLTSGVTLFLLAAAAALAHPLRTVHRLSPARLFREEA